MSRGKPIITSITFAALVSVAVAFSRPSPLGMYKGPFEAKSFGAMTFGPGNVLFVADNDAEEVHAIEIADKDKPSGTLSVEGIDVKVAQALGATPAEAKIVDMAVHPTSHNVYLTVMRGTGTDAKPVLVKVSPSGITQVDLETMKHSSAHITNAAAHNTTGRQDPHSQTITDLAYADGKVWIAGLSNEQFSSSFRQLAFPFTAGQKTTSLEIYHYSHKRSETQSPVMTFAPAKIGGKTYILAAYTCTPLVAFEVSGLADGQKVVGRTVVDLGAGNQPWDIVTYNSGGKDYVLVANRTHEMMKLSADDIANAPALTTPDAPNTLTRTNVSPKGAVVQLADYDANSVVVIQKGAAGLDLKLIPKSSF